MSDYMCLFKNKIIFKSGCCTNCNSHFFIRFLPFQ